MKYYISAPTLLYKVTDVTYMFVGTTNW